MGLNANKIPAGGGSTFKRPPALDAGSYPARLVQVIDLGLQKQRPYQGEEKPPKNEIHTTYEILDEFLKDEDGNDIESKPRWISETIAMHSLSSDLATSTKRYVALDPGLEAGGAWDKLVGTPVIVTISQNKDKKGKVDDEGNPVIYNNISNLSPMRAKDAARAEDLKNPSKVFDLSSPDVEVFLSLPEWLQTRIKDGLDYAGSELERLLRTPDQRENKEAPQEKKAEEPTGQDEDW